MVTSEQGSLESRNGVFSLYFIISTNLIVHSIKEGCWNGGGTNWDFKIVHITSSITYCSVFGSPDNWLFSVVMKNLRNCLEETFFHQWDFQKQNSPKFSLLSLMLLCHRWVFCSIKKLSFQLKVFEKSYSEHFNDNDLKISYVCFWGKNKEIPVVGDII